MKYEDFNRRDDRDPLQVETYAISEREKLPLLKFPLLDETGLVRHCFTTREGGVSEGDLYSLNLSFSRGDHPDRVMENYRRVCVSLGCSPSDVVCSDQTHTTNVLRVDKSYAGIGVTRKKPYTDVDGLITNEGGLVLATFYADCVPLFFVDVKNRAIGLSHSGWRGTVGRMGAVTLGAMQEAFGTNPSDVRAAIGPSICQGCYEVSEDVAARFMEEFGEWESEILLSKGGGKYQLDLWKCNEKILLEAGILPEHLAVTNICTCCNPKLLFSHRASRGKRGNLAAFLMLEKYRDFADSARRGFTQGV